MSNLIGRRVLFACLVSASLGLTSMSAALGQVSNLKDAGEKPAETSKEAKTTKKKKKKKVAPAVVVVMPMQSQTAVEPVRLARVEVNGNAAPIIRPKADGMGGKPSVDFSASGQPHPLGAAASLVISEFRVRGPNGA